MEEKIIGYTQGSYDLFHIGHLNLLINAKKLCDFLIVGVNSDALIEEYKNKSPIIPESERKSIVENIKAVDRCEIVSTLDKMNAFEKFGFNVIFIGDDWKGNSRWMQTEKEMLQVGVKLVYLPHTDGISSTILREKIKLD